jgi:hypothetical protein
LAKLEAAPEAAPSRATQLAKSESATSTPGAVPYSAESPAVAPEPGLQPAASSSWVNESVAARFSEEHTPVIESEAVVNAEPRPVTSRILAEPLVQPKSPAETETASSAAPPRLQAPSALPPIAAYEAAEPRASFVQRLRTNLPLEQFLGMNLFAKIGIVLLVLGFALLGRIALLSMGPAARVGLIYAMGGVMLAGGVRLERHERYQLVGRCGIGGGWALLFFTTYALYHVAPMTVLRSLTADCVLMLIVAVAMVAHTLRYRSQLVTGLAFLLAFSTVALSQDSVYALVAGVILAIGIVSIALRMTWFEVEVFGILASYANHFYWLYKLYPDGFAGHTFPQFWPSSIILILYWAVFRISYVVRKIQSDRQESISTVAALANTMLLLVLMKFESTHPELAFYALLGLGALEFILGQLPVTRRRNVAFRLLTVIGTLLIFAAIPFKFSGNNIALFWMIAAEALLIAGIVQREALFRWLGLLAGCVTGLFMVFEARGIVELRMSSEALLLKSGILLLTSSALFYLNALFLRERWREIFGEFEAVLAVSQNYLGWVTAFLGTWAILTSDWTAVGWAALLSGGALGVRRLKNNHLLAQCWMLVIAVAIRAVAFNCHFERSYPYHVALRLLTLPSLAATFCLTAWLLTGVEDLPLSLRTLSLWLGSSSLVTLAWLELPQSWVAPVWALMAIALSFAARRLRLHSLSYQEHVLAVATTAQLLACNLEATHSLERYIPFVSCAAAWYTISRLCTQTDATYRRPAAWLHTWTATGLLAALAWHESPQPWLTVIWILIALALVMIDRIRTVEELPWQAHVLAALSVLRAVMLDFYVADTWHGVHIRLISVSALVTCLYILARWIRLPTAFRDSAVRDIYSWIGTGLAAWLLWSELRPIYVAVGLGAFGLSLFEIGLWSKQKQLRLQAYTLLSASFVHTLFVNLPAASLPGELLRTNVYTAVLLALVNFYVWRRLESSQAELDLGGWPIGSLMAYFGTGSIVTLLYYQIEPEWITSTWALVVVLLIIAALVLDQEVFLEQTVLLAAGIVALGLAHDVFGVSHFIEGGWRSKFSAPALTAALLFAALPVAFRVRAKLAGRPRGSFVSYWLAARHPEQILFFAPLALVVFTIAVKMNPGMVTLSWCIVSVAAILLGLFVSERSYRLAGLFMLLLCVGKIVFRDAWRLDERDRYITFIVLGAALTLVSALYSKYRDQVSRLL